jgi:tetratricopeptide (TPR) repeat protein
MKYCISVHKTIFTVLFSFIFALLQGQETRSIVTFAEDQYKAGNYSSALIEYQRALFFGTEPTGKIFQQMADCCFNLKKYDQALEFYDRAYFTFEEDTSKVNALMNKAKCNIFTKDYNIALIDLLGITDSLPEHKYRLKQFYTGICYFGNNQFDDARIYFMDAVNPAFLTEKTAIDQLLNSKKLHVPNPRTATVLSMCFPGLGQFYAGDIKNGLNSLLLSTALLALGVKISYEQSVLDAFFTIMPWLQRYYQGGYMRAEKIAIERRAENRNRIYKQVLHQITSTKK